MVLFRARGTLVRTSRGDHGRMDVSWMVEQRRREAGEHAGDERDPAMPRGAHFVDGDALVSYAAPATPYTVGEMRRLLTAFAGRAGAADAVVEAVARAVTEAVGNVVMHAYDPGDVGLVRVTADVEDGALEVIVADDGLGFRPGSSGGMGLGLSMIASSTARFAISTRDPHGTEVWMRFLLET
jgi:anti-sigma regulatory factor (Ser/Thr protein kinase)